MKTKKHLTFVAAVAAVALAGSAQAAPYSFNGYWVDVEAWTGTGSNETILVVDWNRLDNGEATVSESHAFGYRWDGTAYESQMLAAFNEAGILTVTTGYGGAFVYNIGYDDVEDGEAHMHIEEGSWNFASTSDPTARWGTWGDSEWDFNLAGIDAELLADGQFEGVNAVLFYSSMPAYANDQLNMPVPEPACLAMLGFGAAGAILKRRTRS